MTLLMEDIVSFDETPHQPRKADRRQPRREQRSGLTRLSFFQRTAALGTGVGLSVVGLLPPARNALAHTPHGNCTTTLQTLMWGSCPEASDGFGCDPACGPSKVRSNACDANGWHKTSGEWRMRPNECKSGGYDGWFWRRRCGCPTGCQRTFRCHDGCKDTAGGWAHSVCRVTSACQCP
jgi:hypothetical protein